MDKAEGEIMVSWIQDNWKWLAALAVVGGGAYLYVRKQKALNLGDYCAEFFSPYEKKWVRGGCVTDRKDAEVTARNMRSIGWTTRVAEK